VRAHRLGLAARFGLLIGLLLAPLAARAGGFDYPDHGTTALARGATFVARADDPTALLYNPAGVARLQGTHVLINGNLLIENIRYQRREYPAASDPANLQLSPDRYRHDQNLRLKEVYNDDAPFMTPFVAVTSDLGVLRPYRLTLMAGFYGPHVHPSHTFPRYCKEGERLCEPSDSPTPLAGPTRYDLVSEDVLVFYPTIGLAWQPIKGLSIGGHFQAAYGSFSMDVAVGATNNFQHPDYDADIRLETRDKFTPTGILGVHWEALSWLELGASVRFGYTFDFEGEVHATLPETLKDTVKLEPNPANLSLSIPMPWVVRSGARYVNRDGEGRERFDVELDFVWESTGQVETFEVKTDAKLVMSTIEKAIESLNQDHHWDDTWSLRLGGSYHLRDLFRGGALVFRAGTFYESAAAPEAFTRLDFLPFARIGVTAGVGVEWGRYHFGVGYAYLHHFERNVAPAGGDARTGLCAASGGTEGCGSGVIQIVPIDPEAGKPVANGVYDVAIHIVTIGAMASFGG
jgi:long-subunit fatty acid transport protein